MTCDRSRCKAKATHMVRFYVEGTPIRRNVCGECFEFLRGSSMSMSACEAEFNADEPPGLQ